MGTICPDGAAVIAATGAPLHGAEKASLHGAKQSIKTGREDPFHTHTNLASLSLVLCMASFSVSS